MNIYYVTIGRYTRRGSFETLVSKAISASDSIELGTILSYFQKQYEGFDVKVQNVPLLTFEQEVPPQPPEPPVSVPKLPERPIPYLTDIRVKLTDEEKAVLEDYMKCLKDYKKAKSKLFQLVRDRYHKLEYVDRTSSIEIQIDEYGSVDIKRLPICVKELYLSALDGSDGK